MSRLILGKAGVAAMVVVLGAGTTFAAGRGGGFASRGVARGSVSSVSRNVGGGSFNRSVDVNRNVTNVNRNVTNVNRNVNVNRNIDFDRDIDVDHRYGWGGGCCYHPAAAAAAVTAAAVTTAAVVGSVVHTLPTSCSAVMVNGFTYQQCGSTWYQPQFSGSSVTYVVVDPPQ